LYWLEDACYLLVNRSGGPVPHLNRRTGMKI
jgi:hypothetical protein